MLGKGSCGNPGCRCLVPCIDEQINDARAYTFYPYYTFYPPSVQIPPPFSFHLSAFTLKVLNNPTPHNAEITPTPAPRSISCGKWQARYMRE